MQTAAKLPLRLRLSQFIDDHLRGFVYVVIALNALAFVAHLSKLIH